MSLVACDILDGFVDKYTSLWDVTASVLLIKEAGRTVTNLVGDPVDLSVGERAVHLVASNGRIHEELFVAYASTETG